MVDRISGNQVDNNSLLQVGQNAVEKVNQQAAKEASESGGLSTLDQATISDEALKAYEQEKEVLKFSRLAQRVQEYDADKVARMKDLVNSGRINDYLRNLDNGALADSILNSAAGAFLR